MTYSNWAEDDVPYHKLKRKGVAALSDKEILSLIISNGSPNVNSLDIAGELLQSVKNNLKDVGKLTSADFLKIKGLTSAKATALIAALEFGRRKHAFLGTPLIVRNSQDIVNYIKPMLEDLTVEHFTVMYLNRAKIVLNFETVSIGGVTGTVADPRVILKKALEMNAVGLVLAHNHPSGSIYPSTADENLTQKIKQAALLLDITLIDHIIVSSLGYYSFADEGCL